MFGFSSIAERPFADISTAAPGVNYTITALNGSYALSGQNAGNVGSAGATNTGGGGGGGGTGAGTTPGLGGGAGGYVEAIINSPSATYSYAVGAGGTAGTAGTGGAAGGGGGSGVIIVEEHYWY